MLNCTKIGPTVGLCFAISGDIGKRVVARTVSYRIGDLPVDVVGVVSPSAGHFGPVFTIVESVGSLVKAGVKAHVSIGACRRHRSIAKW
jgi:hypothetical protein